MNALLLFLFSYFYAKILWWNNFVKISCVGSLQVSQYFYFSPQFEYKHCRNIRILLPGEIQEFPPALLFCVR